MTTNINNSPEYACRTCAKQECGCKDTECQLPCHFYTEQAEQEPVGVVNTRGGINWRLGQKPIPPRTKLYTHPVRTKDLTDDEIVEALGYDKSYRLKRWVLDDARAVIAADRELNK